MSDTRDLEESGGDRARAAERVVLSYPADLSERARERVGQEYYRTYLSRTLDRVQAGEVREEFTDVGCCGSQQRVPFRVEAVEGGAVVTADTEIAYAERAACGVETGWALQNEID